MVLSFPQDQSENISFFCVIFNFDRGFHENLWFSVFLNATGMHHIQSILSFALYALVTASGGAGLRAETQEPEGTISFDRLTEEQGLSSRITYYLMTDHYGFLWIATNNGLDRFDGNGITTFGNRGRDSVSLPRADIYSMHEDPSGRLWIATGDGLSRFDRRDQNFHTVRAAGDRSGAPGNVIHAIHGDRTGVLWLFTAGGLLSYDPDGDRFESFGEYRILPGFSEEYRMANIDYDANRRYCEDRAGNIWIGTMRNGLFRISPVRKRVEHFLHDPGDETSLAGNAVTEIREGPLGRIWIICDRDKLCVANGGEHPDFTPFRGKDFSKATGDRLLALHTGRRNAIWVFGSTGMARISASDFGLTGHPYPESLASPVVYGRIAEDAQYLWICTNQGLCRFNKFTKEMVVYRNGPGKQDMQRDVCYSAVRDGEGALWINHLYPGIDRARPERKPISGLLPFPGEYSGLGSYCIPFSGSSGRLWVGHRGGGLVEYRIGDNGKPVLLSHYSSKEIRSNTLSSNRIIDLAEDREGRLWIGTENGLNELDQATGRITRYFRSQNKPAAVAPLFIDGSGVLWMGLEGRLVSMDPGRRDYRTLDLKGEDSTQYGNLWINDIYEDVSGNFWVATGRKGLLLVNRGTGMCRTYRSVPGMQGTISCNNINAIYEDRQGRFWIGTEAGLNRMDRESGSFRVYGKDEGFYDDYIFDIGEDGAGRLWLCTRKGITRFDPESGSVLNLAEEDGMVNSGFIFRCSRSGETGMMYFGGPEGIDYLDPRSISSNPFIPPVYITGIRINNRSVHFDRPVPDLEEIDLGYRDNDITLSFVSMNFTKPWKNRYAYMLDDYDKEWIRCGPGQEARYTSIDPGRYVFRVKASNNDLVWNEDGRNLVINIRPPWWRTGLAIGAYILLAVGIVLMYIRIRTWRLENEKKELEGLVRERTEEMRKAQSRLILAEKMAALGELVGGMTHEISTPVGVSVTAASKLIDESNRMAKLFEQDEISRGEFREYLETADQTARLILSNMERTDAMLTNFKQVSVDPAGERKRIFRVGDFIGDLVRSLKPKTDERQIGIELACPPELEIDSYPGALAQIVTNLVINSLKHGFSDPGGKITISAERTGEAFSLQYADNGKGIPPDVLPRIFDPFFTTDHKAGTGLGLHIVYNLVTVKLEGSIDCDSTEGKGVRFTIRFPAGEPGTD